MGERAFLFRGKSVASMQIGTAHCDFLIAVFYRILAACDRYTTDECRAKQTIATAFGNKRKKSDNRRPQAFELLSAKECKSWSASGVVVKGARARSLDNAQKADVGEKSNKNQRAPQFAVAHTKAHFARARARRSADVSCLICSGGRATRARRRHFVATMPTAACRLNKKNNNKKRSKL